MKFIAKNCKLNTELLNKTLDEGLIKTLKVFACKYNHCFRPQRDDCDKKYAIVYHEGDLALIDYIGADVYSQIWFDDMAITRLAIELYRDSLVRYFENKNQPKYKLGDRFHINHSEPTVDGLYIVKVNGDYEIEKIDDISFENVVVYYMRKVNSTDKILVRQDILDKSENISR